MLALLLRTSHGFASRWRNLWYRLLGVRIDGYCWLGRIEVRQEWSCVRLGAGAALDDGVILLVSRSTEAPSLEIGAETYVNRNTIFDAHEKLHVGKNCLIGPHCYFTDGNHGLEAGLPFVKQPMRSQPVIIEDNVWIGAHCVILPGVTVGTGSVIGAGSVVTRSIPPGAVAYGNPARVGRMMRNSTEVQGPSSNFQP